MESQPDVLDSARAGRLVARGGAVRVAGFAAGLGMSLVSVVLVTRHLGVADYGRYQAVIALVTVVGTTLDAGLGTLALRRQAQDPASAQLGVLLGLRLVLAAAAIVVAVAAALVLGYDTTMLIGAVLFALAGVPTAAQTTLTVPLQVQLRIGTVTLLDVARQALTSLGLAGLVVAGAGLLPFFGVPLAVAGVVLVLTVAVTGPRRPELRTSAWRPVLGAALVFGVATVAGVVYLYTSLIVCELAASARETGWFSASFRVIAIVAAVPALVGTTAFPLLSRAAATNRERLSAVVAQLVQSAFLLGGAAALVAVLGAPAIISVLAGPRFAPAAAALRIQGAALGLTFVISALGFTLLALHRHRALLASNALALATSATAVALLAAAHGARGAATGAALAEAVLCTAYAVAVRRDVPLRPAALAPAVAALGLGLAAGVALPVPAVPATVAGLLVYGGAAVLLGAVPAGFVLRGRAADRLP